MRRRGRPPHPDVLTPREWEVLSLLRDNLSNEEIAERLGITVAGAKYHVSEILSKLGVRTREEAAAWHPGEERGWSLGRLAGAAAGVAVMAAAVGGLALLAWGVSRAGDGEVELPAYDFSGIVDGRVVYLPPESEDDWIAPPAFVLQSGIEVVGGAEELEERGGGAVGIIIDRDRFGEVGRTWLGEQRTRGAVIVGGRVRQSELLGAFDGPLTENPAEWPGPGVPNFYSLHAECGSRSGGGTNHLGIHPENDFRFMLVHIQNHSFAGQDCGIPVPTPAGVLP
jgi:DNA-binding CsgD family transcriptional regulator